MRNTILKYYSAPLVLSIILLALFFIMPSCRSGGGGGDSGDKATGLPYIYAELFSLPTGSSLPGYINGSIYVVDYDTGTIPHSMPAICAIGMGSGMNTKPFTYNSTSKEYEGDLVIAPGDWLYMYLCWYMEDYGATGQQLASYPTITEPVGGSSWAVGLPHTIKWSGDYPKTDTFIGVGILDPADPNGPLLWPIDGYFQVVSSSETSYTIPANSLTVGNRLAIVAIYQVLPVYYTGHNLRSHSAAPGSAFVVGGFNFVPITVTP